MPEARARFVVVAISAAALYYLLIPYAVGHAFVIVPGRETLLSMIDSQRVATHMWLQFAHTLAVLVAAVPVAGLIHFTCRSHAIVIGAVAGTLVALASLMPTLLTESVRAVLTDTHLVVLLLDHTKIALMVPALVWLGQVLPSNNALKRTRGG